MSKTTGLVAALGAFGTLAYLMAPLPPEEAGAPAIARPAVSSVSPATQPAAAVTPVSHTAPATAPRQDPSIRLVRLIQTELLRLGCYSGAVNGRWTSETQLAMHALGERVRILRPVDTPDYIMLALARSQESHVCTPRDLARASRPPAQLVPLAGPWDTKIERLTTAGASSPRRGAARTAENARTRTPAPTDSRTAAAAGDEVLPLPRPRREHDYNRMSLGAATDDADPRLDPRDPSSPAIRAPAPRTAGARRTRRTAETRAAPRPPRDSWRRTVFTKLRFDGP